jgi:hypothetical protein
MGPDLGDDPDATGGQAMRTVSVRLNDADSIRLERIAVAWVMEPGEALRKLIRDQAERNHA